MRVTKEVSKLLETEKGCLKVIAIKLCELVELTKASKNQISLFDLIFGKRE